MILEAYKFRGYDKGARGIYMRLLHMNPPVVMNIKKIRRLMNEFALICPIRRANPYRRMAQSIKTSYVAPNILNREFRMHGPRKVLLTDITYILFGQGKRGYLSTIIDAYTKQVLSYVFSHSLELDFVLESVRMLINDHGVSLRAETLVNSDQGAHYTSYKFIRLLKDENLRQSMSRRANCWDNAPQESFYGHMKDEIDVSLCETHEQVAAIIDDWILYKSANPAAPFFFYESSMGVCICTINVDHIFYKNFMTHIDNNPDNKIAFELFIASLVRAIDETTEKRREVYDYLVTEWNEKLRKYIDAQVNGTEKEF